MAGLADIATDLGEFIRETAPELTAPAGLTAEQADAAAGGVLDYVFAQAEPGDASPMLGEAMVVGALAAAQDLDIPGAPLAEAVVDRLEQMAKAARSALTEATAPSAEGAKLLKAVQGGGKKKHVSARMVAQVVGLPIKKVLTGLDRLRSDGYLDYNLKSGYTVSR